MTTGWDKFLAKLQKVAKDIAAEKPTLHFFGLVHDDEAPPDRWDLLVSSDQLKPWSMEAIRYVVHHLRQKRLAANEMVRISQIVALPRDNVLIRDLLQQTQTVPGRIRGLHPMDYPEDVVVLWPMTEAAQPVKAT